MTAPKYALKPVSLSAFTLNPGLTRRSAFARGAELLTLAALGTAAVRSIRSVRAADAPAGPVGAPGGASSDAAPRIGVFCFTWAGSGGEVASEMKRLNPSVTVTRIERAKPYPEEYTPTTEEAKREKAAAEFPELRPMPVSPKDFDVVVIGHPVWGGNLPRPLFTFLREHAEEFRGRRVLHYAMHGGSGLGDTDEDMRALLPGVPFRGVAFYGWGGLRDRDAVGIWMKQEGLL